MQCLFSTLNTLHANQCKYNEPFTVEHRVCATPYAMQLHPAHGHGGLGILLGGGIDFLICLALSARVWWHKRT